MTALATAIEAPEIGIRETRTPAPGGLALRAWLAGAGLVFVTLLTFSPLAGAKFIWDDDNYVQKNVFLHSARGLWQIWLHPFHPVTPQYYPFTFTTFWLEYHAWALRPVGFHIVNIVLHAISAVVLWRLLRRLQVPAAWLAAAVFALHPVHVESVGWISERKNVLSGLLFLLSLTFYLRWLRLSRDADASSQKPSSVGWYIAAFLVFALALLSKTVTSSLPAVVLLILYWKHGRFGLRDVLPLVPFFALGISLGSLTGWLERHVVGADGPEWKFTFLQRILIASRNLWFYAQKLVWPSRLTFIYPRWPVDHLPAAFFAFAIAAIAVPVSLWLLRNRIGRGPLVAVLFFAGCLFPALGFVNLYPMRFSFVADHFQYLASIGLIVLVIAGGTRLLQRVKPGDRVVGPLVGGAVVVLLALTTYLRTGDFLTAKILWKDTVAKNPGAWMAYNNLATLLMREHDYDGARKALDSALIVEPHYVYSRLNRVILNLLVSENSSQGGKHDQTQVINEARQAIADVSSDQSFLGRTEQGTAWKLLGSIYFSQHNDPAALDALQHVLAVDPTDVLVRRDLARSFEHVHDLNDALSQWNQVIEYEPANAQAHAHSALLLAHANRTGDAAKELALAQKLDSRYSAYTLTTPLQP